MDLFSIDWWFMLRPPYVSATLRVLFVFFLAVTLLGGAIRLVSRRQLKDKFTLEAARRVATLFATMGIFGVVYWFFAVQNIPFVSSRFWLLIWVVTALVWFWFILRYIRKEIPAQRARLHDDKEKKRYMKTKHG